MQSFDMHMCSYPLMFLSNCHRKPDENILWISIANAFIYWTTWTTERWTPQVGRYPEKNEEAKPKKKTTLSVDVIGDGSKVRCCKEQYWIGTWNVRFMNQGKLEVVKQEMARVNINILGINELQWTGIGKFNSDDHYNYYCGQESLRKNEVALTVNKRVWNAVLGGNLKN